MKELINPEFIPCKDEYRPTQSSIESELENKYKDKFKAAINILQKAKLVELEEDKIKKSEARQSGGRTRNSYKLSRHLLSSSSDDEEKIYDDAIQKLRSFRLIAKTTGNTVTNKKEIRSILDAKEYITERLSTISIKDCSDRTVFHWFSAFLIMKYANVDISRVLEDIITYIRYNNIKFTPIPVTNTSLSEWDGSYTCWKALEQLLIKETSIPITWKTSILKDVYEDSSNRLINDLTEVLSALESYKKESEALIPSVNNLRNGWLTEFCFSLLYVRATIEMNSSNNDALGHLEQLYKNITTNKGTKNLFDLCLVISKLSRIACEDSFEYASKARKWIFAITNTSGYKDNFDALNVLTNIYLHLIGMSCEDDICDNYRKKCTALIRQLKPNEDIINHIYEVIIQKYMYLVYSVDFMRYADVVSSISDLWYDLQKASVLADDSDPRFYILKYNLFILAAKYINEYLEFGYSLSLLTVEAYIHLKKIGVKEQIPYYDLLEGLGEFVKDIKPDIALRVKIQLQPRYPNKLYINRDIAIQLFDRGCFDYAFEYAQKAENTFDYDNLNDIESRAYYIDVRLIQVNALFLLGDEHTANNILSECGCMLSALEDLYPENERSCILQGVIDHFSRLKSDIEKRPYYARELRLDYIINAIADMENRSADVDSFYDQWKQFNIMYMYHKEYIDEALISEFESDSFTQILEDIASHIEFKSSHVDLSPLHDDEIIQLRDNLYQSYVQYQRTFLINDCEDTIFPDRDIALEIPTYDSFFELFQDQNSAKALESELKEDVQGSCDIVSIKDLEKYHYVIMSEFSKREDALLAADKFLKKLDKIPESTYTREMAAEVLCQLADFKETVEWNEKEVLLNQAESYIYDTNHKLISDTAKELYVRILRRLYDVYDYQGRSGLEESLMVENALNFIISNDIRTIDAAWFLGERGEHLIDEAKRQNNESILYEAKNLLSKSVEILESINPQTDDSSYYLEIYGNLLTQSQDLNN